MCSIADMIDMDESEKRAALEQLSKILHIKKCMMCSAKAKEKWGNWWLCQMHFRHQRMRSGARRRGKYVPSLEELSLMNGSNLICPDCQCRMNWMQRDGGPTVASLQHYRDGSMAIVCKRCNTRHHYMPDDIYRSAPKDHLWCNKCKTLKHEKDFSADRRQLSASKKKSQCKSCSRIACAKYRRKIACVTP